MNYMKKIVAVVLVCMMLVPMAVSSFAFTADATVSANWTVLAAGYNKGTWTPYAPASNQYQLKTDKFTFTENAKGGISVHTPTYAENRNVTYGTTVMTSKATTALDGLTVSFTADQFDSMVDTAGAGNALGVIWSETPISEITGGYEAATNTWTTGNSSASLAYKSGLRNLIPTTVGQADGIPASDKNATPNGQALYIGVNIKKQQADLSPVASSIDIVYYDGQYINKNDGQVGYRWSLIARNHPDTQLGDSTACSRGDEKIDLANGLTVNVRADDAVGYIVNVNGIDYYKGTDVGYFPDANVNGYSQTYSSDDLNNLTDTYLTTMTAAQADINLSGLKTAGKGYVTVGAVSINNSSTSTRTHVCDYTVNTINGVAAADWKGEALACTHSFVAGWTKAATCTQPGGNFYKCSKCGTIEIRNKVEATGHTLGDMYLVEDSSCCRYGLKAQKCTVCNVRPVVEAIPLKAHTWGDWVVTTPATETEPGEETRTCTFYSAMYNEYCGATETREIPATGTPDPEPPVVCEHVWGDWEVTVAPTETTAGLETRTCTLCGATEENVIPKTGKDWKITFDTDGGVMPEGVALEYGINTGENYKEATGVDYPVPTMDGFLFDGWYWEAYAYTLTEGDWNDGYFAVSCDVPVIALWVEDPNWDDGTLKVGSVSNYTVTLKNVNDVKEIRFAIGNYTTVGEFRNDPNSLTLSAALAKNYIVDGVFTYDVAYTGHYTFCIRHNDGTNEFIGVDVNDVSTYLTSDGLRLTVNDMKAASTIKDMWIAQGTWNTYSEIKNNVAAGAKYQATATKLANYFATNDFTYTCLAPGAHTVLIRYNDGSVEALHIELTVDVPTFSQYGLQLTIGNIPGVKIIRSAYGTYNSVAEIKKAPLLRCFNNKTAIKDAESYRIQYRENGVVTVIVEYATGYKHIEHITIAQKESTCTLDGNKVTIGDLETGFMMIRYAEGTYKTSNGVKNATGSKYVKADGVVDGKIVVENLAPGNYTFCVQYDDESFNFHYVTVA